MKPEITHLTAPRVLLDRRYLTRSELLVFAYLHTEATIHGRDSCWPTLVEIDEATGLGQRAVEKAIAALQRRPVDGKDIYSAERWLLEVVTRNQFTDPTNFGAGEHCTAKKFYTIARYRTALSRAPAWVIGIRDGKISGTAKALAFLIGGLQRAYGAKWRGQGAVKSAAALGISERQYFRALDQLKRVGALRVFDKRHRKATLVGFKRGGGKLKADRMLQAMLRRNAGIAGIDCAVGFGKWARKVGDLPLGTSPHAIERKIERIENSASYKAAKAGAVRTERHPKRESANRMAAKRV